MESRNPDHAEDPDHVGHTGHTGDVRAAMARHLPGHRVETVTPLGAGQDNVAYEVNGDLILRFSKEPDPARRAALVEREARLLAVVADLSPVPVPEPAFTIAAQGCLAYPKLPGRPLLDLPAAKRSAHGPSVAATLGALLAAAHAVPAGLLTGLAEVDDSPPSEWLREASEICPAIIDEIPPAHHRAVRTFLGTPPPDDGHTPVFSHNDLGIEHVLVAPATGTVTGVIDWSDAAIVDPAYDFGLLYRDLGPTALDAALDGYRSAGLPNGLTTLRDLAVLRERAVFYGRCRLFEDLEYGIETGRELYVGKCLTAVEWLFPA
ncbi:phosphotransferase [Streptosporangium sp. NPDC048865]|uniref:phosphotransferase family protein n=1 Tax=Streptosporangium sp. NPDC048865 TaxID=3155766 RepID=UPI003426795B